MKMFYLKTLLVLTVSIIILLKNIKLYRLGIGDRLRLDIQLIKSLDLTVLPDGTINFPRIGSIYIENLIINEAKNLITKFINQYLESQKYF